MPFITLFSAPKPFADPHIALIQRNAVRSWRRLPDVEVLLIGDEPGLEAAAGELGARHLAQVQRNPNGTPLLSSMFELARSNSESPLLAIVNTDIILLDDFFEAARTMLRLEPRFVLLSRRWDVQITASLDLRNGWQGRLRDIARSAGQLHRPAGSDYFVFPRACFPEVPAFAIGRAGWDNWMIYEARRSKWPVVDATPSVTVLHQSHDYSHLPNGKAHYTLPETDENIRLAGGQAAVRFTLLDATHQLVSGRLTKPRLDRGRLTRQVELLLRALFGFLPERQLENIVRPKRWLKRLRRLLK
jgi:hypothetical protein